MRGTDVVALLVTRKTMKVQNEANTSIQQIKPAHNVTSYRRLCDSRRSSGCVLLYEMVPIVKLDEFGIVASVLMWGSLSVIHSS